MATITCHQALHGYAAGHKLLAASTSLGNESERSLLFLSDPPGPQLEDGGWGQVSGRHLPGSELYAIGMTWSAPEMPRPGCVWTHTVLLDPVALINIKAPVQLLDLFRRPVGPVDLAYYSSPLHVEASKTQPFTQSDLTSIALLSPATDAIFDSDEAAWLSTPAPLRLLPGVLRLWGLLWPEARRDFGFHIGGIPRTTESLALQVIRSSSIARYRGAPGVRLVDEGTTPTWVSLLIEILGAQGASSFQDFMWSLAPGNVEGRRLVPVLVEAFSSRSQASSPSRLVATVARRLPRRADGGRLKALLLAYEPTASDDREAELLVAVMTAANRRAFDWSELRIGDRLDGLWSRSPDVAAKLLAGERMRGGPEYRRVVASSAHSLTAAKLVELAPSLGPTLIDLVAAKPALAAERALWAEAGFDQRELVSVLTSAKTSTAARRSIVAAMAAAGQSSMAAEVVDSWREDAAIGWAMAPIAGNDRAWRAALSAHPDALARALGIVRSPSDLLLEIATEYLPPTRGELRNVADECWIRFLDSRRDYHESLHAAAFVFALARAQPRSGDAKLFSRTFGPLHSALAQGPFSERAWALLAPVLPPAQPHHEWDRCARLRAALVEVAAAGGVPNEIVAELLHGLTSPRHRKKGGGGSSLRQLGDIVRRRVSDS